MNKLLCGVVLSGLVVGLGCGGDPVPPKGTLSCDGGRCRDGGVDLRVDRAPPAGLDGGPGVDAPQDSRPIVDTVAAEARLAADVPLPRDTADAPLPVDTGRLDLAPPDTTPAVDRPTDPAAQADAVDAPLVVDAPPDLPWGPEATAFALEVGTEAVAVDTTPAVDLASDDTADAAPDTATVDVENDTAPACPGALCDDFEDGDLTGWTILGDGAAADWAVALDGNNHVLRQNTDTNATLRLARAGQISWADQTVKVRLEVASYGAAANANRVLVCARTVNVGSAYCLAISADGGGTLTMLKRRPQGGGSWEPIGTPVTGIGIAAGTWHTVQLVVSGSSPVAISAYLDPSATPTPTLTASDATQTIAAGNIAVGTEGAQADFDAVLVTTP